jgi:hypothetical protein
VRVDFVEEHFGGNTEYARRIIAALEQDADAFRSRNQHAPREVAGAGDEPNAAAGGRPADPGSKVVEVRLRAPGAREYVLRERTIEETMAQWPAPIQGHCSALRYPSRVATGGKSLPHITRLPPKLSYAISINGGIFGKRIGSGNGMTQADFTQPVHLDISTSVGARKPGCSAVTSAERARLARARRWRRRPRRPPPSPRDAGASRWPRAIVTGVLRGR